MVKRSFAEIGVPGGRNRLQRSGAPELETRTSRNLTLHQKIERLETEKAA